MRPRPPNWLFDAGPQRSSVLGVTVFAALCALGSTWAGWGIWHALGLTPATGNQLSPWQERLFMVLVVAGLGWGFLGGMLVYLRCYVSQIVVIDADTVELRVLLSIRPIRVDGLNGPTTQAHEGRFERRMAVTVSAPWTSLRLPERRLPLIIDEQGEWNKATRRPNWLQ